MRQETLWTIMLHHVFSGAAAGPAAGCMRMHAEPWNTIGRMLLDYIQDCTGISIVSSLHMRQ